MWGRVEVELDSYKLNDYRDELVCAYQKMNEDIEEMKSAFEKNDEWNDMVSEKARIALNSYIDSYNIAMDELAAIITAVEKMCAEIYGYKTVDVN